MTTKAMSIDFVVLNKFKRVGEFSNTKSTMRINSIDFSITTKKNNNTNSYIQIKYSSNCNVEPKSPDTDSEYNTFLFM